MRPPTFTVFTATYNRAHTLPDVYQSLLNQTFKAFEWVIVDDGSQDGTSEIVASWIADGRLKIRYFRQENSGKHVAFNAGVKEAAGDLFLSLDSDDIIFDCTLEIFYSRWREIPEGQRACFSGITAQCVDEQGKIVGVPLGVSYLDGKPYEVIDRYGLDGERFGFHRTEILRAFPFPTYLHEKFVPEALVWNRIGRVYNIRFIDEALRVYRSSGDGLSAAVVKIRMQSPIASTQYYTEAIALPTKAVTRLKFAINALRFAHGVQAREFLKSAFKSSPIFMILAIVPALSFRVLDNIRRVV